MLQELITKQLQVTKTKHYKLNDLKLRIILNLVYFFVNLFQDKTTETNRFTIYRFTIERPSRYTSF